MSGLPTLAEIPKATTTDQVFEVLYSAVITLELPPGTKVSEVEIAKRLGVSRQPVRDAFYRLSELGFLRIRPQRATVITHISEEALRNARFVRTALEVECLRVATTRATEENIEDLEDLLTRQQAAIDTEDRLGFHELDDLFHKKITEIAGHTTVWGLIRDQKVHLDRVRYLSLSFGAQSAIDDHRKILDCIKKRDASSADDHLRKHLSRILGILKQVRESHSDYFEDED